MDRAEKFVHGRGSMDGILCFYPHFGKCNFHRTGHDACQYMDCHSGHDNRKGTSICIVGLGSAGSLRFNEVILWNWNRQQTAVIHSMYLSWMNIIIR